jgi:hypothetical protein
MRIGVGSDVFNVDPGGAARIVRNFAESIRDLAKDEHEHEQIRSSCAIPPLIALLGRSNVEPETQAAATAAVALLASDPKSSSAILEVGRAVDSLLRLLQPAPPQDAVRHEMAKFAACAIGNLSSHSLDSIRLVSNAGAIKPLVNFLRECGAEAAAAGDIANALGNLACGHAQNREAIRLAGGVPALVSVLALGVTSEAALLATRAVGSVARDNVANCDAFREAGAIPLLVSLLCPGLSADCHFQVGGVKQATGEQGAEETVSAQFMDVGHSGMLTRCAAEAVFVLACNSPVNTEAFRAEGGVTALVALLEEAKDAMRDAGSPSISPRAGDSDGDDDPLGATAKLWSLLLDPADAEVNAAMVLEGLAQYEAEKKNEESEDKEKAKEKRKEKRSKKK